MKLRQAWRLLQILFIGLLSSLGVYAAILAMLLNEPPAPTRPGQPALDPALFVPLFGALGAMLFVLVPFLRKRLMPPRERVGDGRAVDLDESLSGPLLRAMTKLRVGSIVTWALCESVAIYGFILAFLFRDWTYYAVFGAAGAAAMVYFAPRMPLLEEVVRAARKS